jgi:high-affinity nickel-transport protein
MKQRVILLYCVLGAANLGAWGWAFLEFGRDPVLLGTAFLAYGFGLRHAVDADHIAAIDTVTRKMLHQGRQALGVGFFFSLGHSTVVVAVSVAVAFATNLYQHHVEGMHRLGGVVGTLISAGFLFAMALANLAVFWSVFMRFRRARSGQPVAAGDVERLMDGGGILARLFRPLFRIVARSWHMYPLGVLFGLGFDTATEIGLLGISAAEGARGLSIGAMLVFPALFTAGMSLVDTTDSLLMLKAYGWAFANPFRKLYYNMTVTLMSALVALVIGGIEALGMIGDEVGFSGGLWGLTKSAAAHFGVIGYAIIALFLAVWGGAVLVYRFRGYDRLDAPVSS